MNSRRFLPVCLVIVLTSAFALEAQQDKVSAKLPFNDRSLSIEKRVDDLVGRMTLEEKVEQMRDHAPAIPRLGLPKYDWWNEGLHGVAFSGYATNFPQVIGMAATWDAPLVHRMGVITSTEARAKYNESIRRGQPEQFFGLTFWAPNINIFRDPRWGTRSGDIRRRPIPDWSHGCCVRDRNAGR
jgi:beta-glucosidase